MYYVFFHSHKFWDYTFYPNSLGDQDGLPISLHFLEQTQACLIPTLIVLPPGTVSLSLPMRQVPKPLHSGERASLSEHGILALPEQNKIPRLLKAFCCIHCLALSQNKDSKCKLHFSRQLNRFGISLAWFLGSPGASQLTFPPCPARLLPRIGGCA